MNKYQQTTEKKKAAIIQATLELIKTQGYTNTSMTQIAKEADVAIASIYNYYKNKEAVLDECVKRVMSHLRDQTDTILKDDSNFEDKLVQVILLCSFEENESIAVLFSDAARKDERLNELITDAINREKREIYRKFIDYGRLTRGLDHNIPTDLYLGYIEALNNFGLALDFENNFRENVESVHSLLLYGLIGIKDGNKDEE